MILLIDNYDSFVYNLARYVRELGRRAASFAAMTRCRWTTSRRCAPEHIIVSPGPCSPTEAGISTEVVRRFGAIDPHSRRLPRPSVHRRRLRRRDRARRPPMHGKTSRIQHDGGGVFAGLPSPLQRHPLSLARHRTRRRCPPALRVTATSDDGEIMAVEHREHPVVGVQFHPESALTEHGYRLLDRFLRGSDAGGGALPDRADLAFAVPRADEFVTAAGGARPVTAAPAAPGRVPTPMRLGR